MSGLTRTRAQDLALALRHYLSGAQELARLRAYEAAREAMAEGVGLLEIVADHQEALATILSEAWIPEAPVQALNASAELLAEVLGPFEMAHRGFQEANESLQRVNAELEQQIGERKRAEEWARQAGEQAERANRAKDEFLSRMSHELRTPLNAILGFGQLLGMEELGPEQRESVQLILKGGRHLLDLINEVLDIARIESGRVQLSVEPTLLPDAVMEAIDLIQPLASENGIEVSLDESWSADHLVLADRQRLRQVLLNLLSNAVKYNRQGGKVSVRCLEMPGGRLRVEVGDQGPGIAPEKMDRLFVPFDRLGAEASGIEGTGLGLPLSKRLIEAMEGSMGAESALDVGSTFFFELPVVEDLASLDDGATEQPRATTGTVTGTVLYVEDNTANLRLVERALAYRPELRLVSATLGRDGLELARREPPAVILLDVHLPDIDGEEFLDQLRADPRTREIPVIVISADATPGRMSRLLSAGAQAYLTKPLDLPALFDALDEVLLRDRRDLAG